MKKFVSLLAASALVLTINVTAFAADDIPGTIYADDDGTGISGRAASISPFIAGNVGDATYTVGQGELFLVDRGSNVVAGVYNHLDPDKEYTFRVHVNNTGTGDLLISDGTHTDDTTVLTGKMLRGGSVRIRTKKGSSYVSSARIKTTGRGDNTVYDLVINTRAQYGTSMSDVEYILSVTGTKSIDSSAAASDPDVGLAFEESQHSFEVGWMTIEDDETQVGEDGIIVMSNDRPVITKEQFQDISRSANYKNVSFEGDDGGWTFMGRTSGMGSSNFYYTYDVVPELINRFPEQDYKFLSFKGGVTFPTNGEMRIEADEIASEFNANTIYTYLYRNGKLTPVNTTFDSDSREIVFRTNYLGTFVMTDTEITDLSIIGEPDGSTNEPEPEPEPDDNDGDHGNPSTGASSMMDLGMALGLATLVTAGAISRKRK